MIDKQTLKRHNLKAVSFSCIREGETFNIDVDFELPDCVAYFQRRLINGRIEFYDGMASARPVSSYFGYTVYVPVWRVCKEVE